MSEEGAAASPPPLWALVGEVQGGGNPRPRRSGVPPPLTPPHVMSKTCLRHDGEGNPAAAVVGGVSSAAGRRSCWPTIRDLVRRVEPCGGHDPLDEVPDRRGCSPSARIAPSGMTGWWSNSAPPPSLRDRGRRRP